MNSLSQQNSSITQRRLRVVINQSRLEPHDSHLFLDENTTLIGAVRRRHCGNTLELIIDQWTKASDTPDGQRFAPMMDWAVMTNTGSDEGVTPVEVIERIQPKKSQLLIAFAIDPLKRDQLPCQIRFQDQTLTPDEIVFIGPGMVRIDGSQDDDSDRTPDLSGESLLHRTGPETNNSELVRRSRTVGAIGDAYFQLEKMSIAINGCGRGGSALATHFVAAGARNLTLIDGDRIGIENVDSMPMITTKQIGGYKSVALGNSLIANQPSLVCHCVTNAIGSPEVQAVLDSKRFDLVVTFVDDQAARLAASLYCQKTETMHLDVGTMIQFESEVGNDQGGPKRIMTADVRLFQPRRGCVACVPEMINLQEVLYELNRPEDCFKLGRPQTWDQQRAGSSLHLNTLACSLALELWLDWLRAKREHSQWSRIGWTENEMPEFDAFDVDAEPSCRFCHDQ